MSCLLFFLGGFQVKEQDQN